MMNYDKVPVDYMRDAVQRYIDHGIQPGAFLTALFSNDLLETYKRADDDNLAAIAKWVAFVYFEMPVGSHGSRSIMAAWCKAGGVHGMEDADAIERARAR